MKSLRLCLSIALLTLSACGGLTKRSVTEPYPSSCSAFCFEPCPALPVWQTRADGSGDWDALAHLTIEIAAGQYARCEERRSSCAACLRRLERVGVIKIGAAPAPASSSSVDPLGRTGGSY